MKAVIPLLLVLLLVPIANVTAQGTDPLSVIKGAKAAYDAGNVEAAVAFYADDAVITNTRGRKIIGKDAIRRFIQGNLKAGTRSGEMLNPQVTGDSVTWAEMERTDFFVKLGIALTEVRTQVVVQNGKINSTNSYRPPLSLVRIQQACENPQAQGVLLYGQSCSEFVQQSKAQTRSVAATLKPFSVETDFKSLEGYLSPLK